MSVQRWKPSWAQGRMIPAGVHPVDGYVSAADHARIVAERVAEVTDALIDARREALAELEQAHAAALAEADKEGEKRGRRMRPTCQAAGELLLAASRRIIELTGERDRAIAVAVRLEQELAEVEDSLGYPTDVILAPFRGETSAALDVPPESSWSP